ncbi:MAG: hypothetical protein LBN32_04880 [Helicobacteraceae bacterium]|jgi:hypothetical protein|nr:hypothetical protein [Helicobacteraceae bacterium]
MELALIDIYLLFGVLLNIVMTFAFGLYKTLNLNYDQMITLLKRYPVKTNPLKLIVLWFVPYAGVCYIFHELFVLQRVIRRGGRVYDYLEAKLRAEHLKQKGV